MSEDKKVLEGIVVFFSNKLGYGFIKCPTFEKDIFVHWSDINSEGFKTLNKDQKVSFEIGLNNHGREKACSVAKI